MEVKKFNNFINENNDNSDELLNKLAKLMYDKYLETLKYYYNNPEKLESDFKLHSKYNFDTQPKDKQKIDYKWAKKIINIIK